MTSSFNQSCTFETDVSLWEALPRFCRAALHWRPGSDETSGNPYWIVAPVEEAK